MGPNNQIALAGGNLFEQLGMLLGGQRAGKQGHVNRRIRKNFGQFSGMLGR